MNNSLVSTSIGDEMARPCTNGERLISCAFVGGFLLAINDATISGLCIYYTMTGYIFPYGAISEKYIIDNFNGDCEMLCYNNSSCVGANIRATANGSIVCEFR